MAVGCPHSAKATGARPRDRNPGRSVDAVFERFSQASRRVVVLAQQEARRLEHDYIGTEHELLGLLLTGDPAVEAAIGTALPVDRAREAIVEIVGRGTAAPRGHISFTPRAKKVLELALREALRLRQRSIQPGHILLALLREGEGVGAQVVAQAGLDFETTRLRTIAALDASAKEAEPSGPTLASAPEQVVEQLRQLCSDDAAAVLDRAVEGGVDGVPTPWSLLRAIAAGDDEAAALVAGLDLSAPAIPGDEPVGRPFLLVFGRAQGLASALGSVESPPGERPVGPRLLVPRIETAHLLAVLLSPGEGTVTGELAALGADPAALRRQVLALL